MEGEKGDLPSERWRGSVRMVRRVAGVLRG